jgi:GNAT superfamily N-acetyltransferase
MPEFHVREVAPGTDWVYESVHELEVALSLERFGEDLSASVEWNRSSHANERDALKPLLLMLPGPAPTGAPLGRFGLPVAPDTPAELLGAVNAQLPTTDNLHLAEDVFCQVRADVRRGGIGTALWREIVRIARQHGRTSVLGWSEHLLATTDADGGRVVPSAGVGWVPLDAGSRFAQAQGLRLAQVERQSRLDLPVPSHRLAGLRAQAENRALPAYRTVSWVGPTPEEHLDRVATMYRALSTDAPTGDVDWQEENWDADRVRRSDRQKHLTGHSVFSLAISAETGGAAGLTEIHVHDAHPHRPEQWTTVVARSHRGHRLGLLLKVANLQLLATDQPEALHLDTWNAGENEHMLAINNLLGYRPHSVHGAWQLRLSHT